MAKKCKNKRVITYKVVVLLIQPIVLLTFSMRSCRWIFVVITWTRMLDGNYSTSWKLKYCWMMTDCIINWLYKIDSGSDRFNCFALEVRFRSAVILFHSCQELLWQITLLKWKYCNNQPACESPASTTGTNGTRQIFDRFNALRCFHLNHAEI